MNLAQGATHRHLHIVDGDPAAPHAHDHAHAHPHHDPVHGHQVSPTGVEAGRSALLAPAMLRLGCSAVALGALWAGVAWAIG